MAKQAEKSKEKTTKEAQKTAPKVQETPPEVDAGTPPEAPGTPPEVNETLPETGSGETPETPPDAATETKKRYIFPRQSEIPCPECGLHETVVTSTPGAIQWRKCTRAIPICTHPPFKVVGTEVKVTDCKQDT